ncbi:MAG: hypothetical protein AAF628_31050 [Planctomycetota bacterium]
MIGCVMGWMRVATIVVAAMAAGWLFAFVAHRGPMVAPDPAVRAPAKPPPATEPTEPLTATAREATSPREPAVPQPPRTVSQPGAAAEPGDALVLRRARFEADFGASFEKAAGRAPPEHVVDREWIRLRDVLAQMPAGLGGREGLADAERRRTIEIDGRDDMLALLADPERQRDRAALQSDPEALARLFAHRTEGPVVDGPHRLSDSEPVPDGTTLQFGPGVHRVSWAAIGNGGTHAPRDLTIRGAGMNATLLELSDFSTRDVLVNLHLRDCTIDGNNDGAFDLRREAASVQADRVRFVRFDAGHGGCYILSAAGGAFYARDCIFAGGYGRSPGLGHLLRNIDLARYERCTFERLRYLILDQAPATFSQCLFRDCPRDQALLESEGQSRVPRTAVVEGCTVEVTLPEMSTGNETNFRRSLTELFPDAR